MRYSAGPWGTTKNWWYKYILLIRVSKCHLSVLGKCLTSDEHTSLISSILSHHLFCHLRWGGPYSISTKLVAWYMYGYWQQQFCVILFYRFGAIEPKVMWKDGLQSIALLFHHNFHSNYYWYLPRSRHTSRWALLSYIGWKQEICDRFVDWPVSLPCDINWMQAG